MLKDIQEDTIGDVADMVVPARTTASCRSSSPVHSIACRSLVLLEETRTFSGLSAAKNSKNEL
ncbi:hypothetical protein RvY_01256 [Ramazzottius varieornatus]|uniref:Uncharacterized protein n=1 Tax=Ramazzottius varieornatus TaxID=947166 RepID=A0A1D1UQZ4_RAMVA|nr:hypothetical protein RvY_01256 [Ramazzottius varieornatus]